MERQAIKNEIKRRLTHLKIEHTDEDIDKMINNADPIDINPRRSGVDNEIRDNLTEYDCIPFLTLHSDTEAIGKCTCVLYLEIGDESSQEQWDEDYAELEKDGEHYAYVINHDHSFCSEAGLIWVVRVGSSLVRYM